MTRLACAVLALLCCSPCAASAQGSPAPPPATPTEPDYPLIRVGALSYVQYDAEMKNRDGLNAFDVTRAYLNLTGQVSKTVRFRFTPDVKRITDGSLSGTLVLRVKYAFAEFDNIRTARSWLRFGAHQTPWLDFEESVNRYRVQGTMFAEREGLIPGSSDFGVGYFSPLGKLVEVQAGVYNGEGYAQAEPNRYKSVQGRATVRPFAGRGRANGLRLSGFYSAGWYAANRPRRLGILMGSFEQPHLVATLQRVAALDNPSATAPRDVSRRGSSGFVELRQGLGGWAALARMDRLDPDTSLGDDSQRRTMAGVAYWRVWPRSRVGLVVTHERVHYAAGARRPDESRVLVQTHVEF